MSVVPTIVEIKSMKSIMLLCKRVLNPNHIGVKYTLVSSGGGESCLFITSSYIGTKENLFTYDWINMD